MDRLKLTETSEQREQSPKNSTRAPALFTKQTAPPPPTAHPGAESVQFIFSSHLSSVEDRLDNTGICATDKTHKSKSCRAGAAAAAFLQPLPLSDPSSQPNPHPPPTRPFT